MKVSEILDELENTGMYKTDRMIYANALFYFGSIMLNGYNVRSAKGNIRFFGITLAPSSSGKDWAQQKVIDVLFQGKEKKYAKVMEDTANNMFDGSYPFSNGLPTNMTVGLEGSKEGLFKVAQGQANSGFGSLNLIANEMGRVIASSSDLIEKTKELYDGTYKAKTIKGSSEDSKECDIENVITNMLMFGSPAGINGESKAQIIELCKSGLYRRSFICNIEPTKQKIKDNLEPAKCLDWFQDIKGNGNITLSDEASMYVKEIIYELLELSNDNLYNDFIQADKSAISIIYDLAHIIAFLERSKTVSLEHIKVAYDYFKLTRSTVSDIFRTTTIHDSIYKILKRTNTLARHELVELDSTLNISKTKWDDAIDILQELCYIKNEYLHTVGSKVVKYSIEELPINNLDKIKIGVTEQEGAYAINFIPYEIPFFGSDIMSIEKLLTSDKSSFTTCHFDSSTKASEGHRRAESFISGQNMVAFDIDDGMELEEAIRILKPYTYLIYTTKSHKIEKYDFRDRFRILLPTKTEYFVDAEQHKQMYENLSKVLGMTSYDVATRNVSRLWFINSGCEIYRNQAELLDVTVALPSTIKEETIMPLIHQVLDDDNIDRRLSGMYRWVLSNTSIGSRNSNMFRFGIFVKEIQEDYDYHMRKLNDMLTDKLSNSEIDALIISVHKKK